jgi:hypothetical protein
MAAFGSFTMPIEIAKWITIERTHALVCVG